MTEKKVDWEKMGDVVALDRYREAEFSPSPPPAYAGILPEAYVESRGPGRPAVGGTVTTPAAGGEAFVSGGYQRALPQAPAQYDARLGWRRRF